MKIIRRKRATKRASTVRANNVRWVVYAKQGGGTRAQGTYTDWHEARALVRELKRDCGLPAWVQAG
jgi:hypothetical protein